MKRIDVKTSTYIHFDVENNDIDPKFKAGDHVRVPEHHFCKLLHSKLARQRFCYLKGLRYRIVDIVISDLNDEGFVGTLCKKEFQNTCNGEFTVGKVINKKGKKLYINWKYYDNFFNSLKKKI